MTEPRRPLLAANWKQNMLWQSIEDYCSQLRSELPEFFDEDILPGLDLLLCPPLCYMGLLGALLEQSHVLTGAQLVSTEGGGAFTGEVSAEMVSDLGCDYVIVGHSERRSLFGDTEHSISKRLGQAIEHDLVPILCIGEDLQTRQSGNAAEHCRQQLEAQRGIIAGVEPGEIVIAYEPIWAIGTGENASREDAQEMAALIRDWFAEHISADAAQALLVLYGGSVKPENIADYFRQPDIDGALIGGASLSAASMAGMVRSCLAVETSGIG